MSLPNTVIYFTSYEQLKCLMGFRDIQHNPFVPAIAGGIARIASVVVTSPLELIRTKKMSAKLSYADLLGTLRTSIAADGVRILWRGLVPTVWRDLPFSGELLVSLVRRMTVLFLALVFYWTVYERLKCRPHYLACPLSSFFFSCSAD